MKNMNFRLSIKDIQNPKTHRLPRSIVTLALSTGNIQPYHAWLDNNAQIGEEVSYQPHRVLLQDFTGVPVAADLAAIRHAVNEFG